MSGTAAYDALIMEHIKNARNYCVPEDANRTATGANPLCGDELTVYLKVERERIEEITFQCTCCGISMASASIMTGMIKGQDARNARLLLQKFIATLHDRAAAALPDIASEQRAILATVRKYPSRVQCAALPWATLDSALDNLQDTVFVR